MSDGQFMKLFRYMQEEFAKVHEKLDQKADREQLDHIMDLMNYDVKQREIDNHERLAMSAQLDRHEERLAKVERKLA